MRANLALENKQFVNDMNATFDNTENAEDVEREYSDMCVKADKVTLKLLFSLLGSEEGGFMERALDVTKRLHHEKSFDLAMKAADLRGLTKLSDQILDAKENRFNDDFDESDEESVDDKSLDESMGNGSEMPTATRRVSPVSSSKRKEREEDLEQSGDEVPSPKPVSRRRLNPFARKHKESPPKTLLNSPVAKKPTLSRMSTFSAQSRQKSKISKHLL